MARSDFLFREKIPVAILGATGSVGQQFVSLLANHPWFEIAAVCASERSVGKTYREAVKWILSEPLPAEVADMRVQPCIPGSSANLYFSALDASVAGEIEIACAEAGAVVVSNSSNHRMDPLVPLLVPEVNSDHLQLLKSRSTVKGLIVTNPNCAVVGLVMALKPLVSFGLEKILVTTLQAVSGAGYPGLPSVDILDNVIPFISNEEDKIETEPLKILGSVKSAGIEFLSCHISAQVNRVPVTDGHLECVSIKLKNKPALQEIKELWRDFKSTPQLLDLPSAPQKPLIYFEEENYPQPRLHRRLENGMAVSLGRLRDCPVLDLKFVLLSHNTVRGAAGGAILNAELLVKEGHVFW